MWNDFTLKARGGEYVNASEDLARAGELQWKVDGE